MTIEKYEELTGRRVPESQQTLITAQLNKSRIILESLLGYSLLKSKASENQYEELGISRNECSYDDGDELNDPDEVEGSYRLFPYNEHDEFLPVDPYTKIYKVKLVRIKTGGDENGITIRTFTDDQVSEYSKGGFSKYIKRCQTCFCLCDCTNCVQLAVDAEWVNESCLPEELNMLWADMGAYYADCKKDLKSETLGSHSYTKFDKGAPELWIQNISIIKKYAGPNGTVNREPV